MNGDACIICNRPALLQTEDGPVCAKHVDLAKLLGYDPTKGRGIQWYALVTGREWNYQRSERDD